MLGTPPDRPIAGDHVRDDRPSFLESHRALAACTREFGRLADAIIHRLAADPLAEEKPVVRQSPGRCIVQLGPVALTLTWLRSTLDSVAEGQLLVIGWRGSVAPKSSHSPERGGLHRAPLPATALWEEVLVAVAADEASWLWRAPAGSVASSSADLGRRWVERLRCAHTETRATAAATSTHTGKSASHSPIARTG